MQLGWGRVEVTNIHCWWCREVQRAFLCKRGGANKRVYTFFTFTIQPLDWVDSKAQRHSLLRPCVRAFI